MSGFLLKNTLMRRRKAIDAVFLWLEAHGIDPEKDCYGAPAASAFVAKLLSQQPKGPYSFIGAKKSKLIGPHGFELAAKDVKEYLWGKEEFRVFNLDSKKDTTAELKAQLDEAAKGQLESRPTEPVPEPDFDSEPIALPPEPEELKSPKTAKTKRRSSSKKTTTGEEK